jgi:hypothetical protein
MPARALTLLLALLTLCCGGAPADPPPRACLFALPAACPPEVPSYAADIEPLVAARCAAVCHRAGGVALNQPLAPYPQLFSRRGAVLGQIYRCRMPPPEAEPLSASEGARFIDWLTCGAPSN